MASAIINPKEKVFKLYLFELKPGKQGIYLDFFRLDLKEFILISINTQCFLKIRVLQIIFEVIE